MVERRLDFVQGFFDGLEITQIILCSALGHISAGHCFEHIGNLPNIGQQPAECVLKHLRQCADLVIGRNVDPDVLIVRQPQISLFQPSGGAGDLAQRIGYTFLHVTGQEHNTDTDYNRTDQD